MMELLGRALLALLISLPFGPRLAAQAERQSYWSRSTKGDAEARKNRVERGMLPNVVFAGETEPAPVETRMLAHEIPALSVAVIRDGTLDWSAAYGKLWTNGPPADCNCLFQAASLAKPVTLLAALRLEQEG
jgi:CubicO group peptidase (beta-lactamase class C family)